ncbi:hypothetical protein RF11_13115 [Thelohanellus kitauei]|nr:hypothetical protein RF11_13115 [Thelohanellus kitauei]
MSEFLKSSRLVIAKVIKVSKNNFIKLEAEFLSLDKKYNKFWKRRGKFWCSLTDERFRVGDVVLAEKYSNWKPPLPPSPVERMISDFNDANTSNNGSGKLLSSMDLRGNLPPNRPEWLRRIIPKKELPLIRGKEWKIVKLVEPSMDIIAGEVTNAIFHNLEYKEKSRQNNFK